MRRVILTVALLALVTSACANGDDDDQAAPSPTTAPEQATVETGALRDRDCDYDAPIAGATCHWLDVPENRDDPESRTISMPVTVLAATGTSREPDSVVYLHGGPGDAAVNYAEDWAEYPMRETRDIVLWDQRGSGASEPALECPQIDDSIRANFTSIDTFDDMVATRTQAVQACHDDLVAAGNDLNQYNSETVAADLEALRLALQVPQWNLVGVSYGTRVGLAYMRAYPDSVRSALLDSVVPTNAGGLQHFTDGADRAFAQLTDGCLADPACATRYPDFATAIDRASSQLDAHPFEGETDLGEGRGILPLAIDGRDAVAGLFTGLYDDELIVVLPSVIEAVAAGDYSAIPVIAQQGIPFSTAATDGIAFSVECADNAKLNHDADQQVRDDPGRYEVMLAENVNTYCDIWDVDATSDHFNDAVHSDIPTLVTAGKYDPVTPPGDSEATAQQLENATFVLVDGIGHSVFFSDECGRQMYADFVADPEGDVDTTCGTTHPGPAFATG